MKESLSSKKHNKMTKCHQTFNRSGNKGETSSIITFHTRQNDNKSIQKPFCRQVTAFAEEAPRWLDGLVEEPLSFDETLGAAHGTLGKGMVRCCKVMHLPQEGETCRNMLNL